ncbi:MAG: phosphate signaling complex protein PhoU [Nocardioides sp.]|nr:phosphate signaling complex protein PhoU [Nocardioides sp.]
MRDAFNDELDSILQGLADISRDVNIAITRATEALMTADRELAEQVITDDAAIDTARELVEEKSFEVLSLQQPVATDLRTIVASLRMVAELERMGDLSVHVAKIARLRVPILAVPETSKPTIARMARVAEDMTARVGVIISERDVDAARDLARDDEEMDALRRASLAQLLSASWVHGVEPAVDLALLGRYYERIADHAVSVANRLVFIVTGELVSAENTDPS